MSTTLLPFAAFFGIGAAFLLIGRWLIGSGRSRTANDPTDQPLVFGRLTEACSRLLPCSKTIADKIRRELKRAGYYQPMALQQFLAVRNMLVVSWILLTGTAVVALATPTNDPTNQILLVGAIVAIMLYALPRLFLQSVASRRVNRIQTGLPDALDMITMCMTGGLPLQMALQRVSGEMRSSHVDLALELEIIHRQSKTYTLEHALLQFSDRIDVDEIRSLTALVTQSERLGTNVADTLEEYSDSIRRAHRQRAEERGNKISVKILLPIALFLAPPVYILLLGPPLLELQGFINRENQLGGVLVPAELDAPSSRPAS